MNNKLLDEPIQDHKAEFSHNFGSYFPLPLVGVGAVMILGGLYSTFTGNFFGLILVPIGIILVFAKKGTAFNFSSNTYKHFFGLFGYTSGKWVYIPECEYISVFAATESQTLNAGPQSTSISNQVLLVNLIHSRNQRLTVFKTDLREDAFKVARFISDKLKLDILDATKREKVWIKHD